MPDTHEMIQQHHELIALCKKLDEAVRCRLPRAEIYRIMDELITCTDHHFKAEERLMEEAGYPEQEAHKAKHRELLESTRRFRRQLNLYGEENFTEWFNHWPFAYILAHIQLADHQIGDHVRHTSQPNAPAGATDRETIPAIMRTPGGTVGTDTTEIKVPRELYARHIAPDGAAVARMAAADAAAYMRGQED